MQICDFPGSRTIGKPVDWNEELDGPCLAIHVCDTIDTLTGLPVQFTLFKLSDNEIAALAAGGLLRLGIVGMKHHPVFNIGVFGAVAASTIDAIPMGDLGGLIAE